MSAYPFLPPVSNDSSAKSLIPPARNYSGSMIIGLEQQVLQRKSPPNHWGPSRAFTFRGDLSDDDSWWYCIPCCKYVCDTHLRSDKHRRRMGSLDYYLPSANSTCLQQIPQSKNSVLSSAWHSFRVSALLLTEAGVTARQLCKATRRAAEAADDDAVPRPVLADFVSSPTERTEANDYSSYSENDADARSSASDSDERSSPSARRKIQLIPRGSLRPVALQLCSTACCAPDRKQKTRI